LGVFLPDLIPEATLAANFLMGDMERPRVEVRDGDGVLRLDCFDDLVVSREMVDEASLSAGSLS
jgi:hypothetical protein